MAEAPVGREHPAPTSTHVRLRHVTADRLRQLRARLLAAYCAGQRHDLPGGGAGLSIDGLVNYLLDQYADHAVRAAAARRRAAEVKKGS